ncbi:MAG: ImmA/IrrE family metallo-endopeptidase [Magnetococcales bacterium]|nr:ImmA/IrrE family metallo-endopeptidase [Magnetococcales bacterium]
MDEIENAAEAFARAHDFDPQRDDVRELVQKLGGELGVGGPYDPDWRPYNPSLNAGEAMRVRREGMRFTIYLPPTTGMLRDNFTIAHELGHLRLHVPRYFEQHPDTTEVVVRRLGNDPPESQANRFAAALLMPQAAFRAAGEESGWDIFRLSVQFFVSRLAAQYRADFLYQRR